MIWSKRSKSLFICPALDIGQFSSTKRLSRTNKKLPLKIFRFFGEMNQRNYQARNMMRDEMKMNDLVLFYHSNTKPHPHIAGIAKALGQKYAKGSSEFQPFDI